VWRELLAILESAEDPVLVLWKFRKDLLEADGRTSWGTVRRVQSGQSYELRQCADTKPSNKSDLELEVPGVGGLSTHQLQGTAAKANPLLLSDCDHLSTGYIYPPRWRLPMELWVVDPLLPFDASM
jgi:hypothetical protein